MRARSAERASAPLWARLLFSRVTLGIFGLTVITAIVCVITLAPTPIDEGQQGLVKLVLKFLHDKGVPKWFGYNKLEFSANILMFVPLGFFIGLVLPGSRRWIGGVSCMLFSTLVELAQLLFLPDRFASIFDVIANSAGGWIGIGLATAFIAWVRARDSWVVEPRLRAREGHSGPRHASTARPSPQPVTYPAPSSDARVPLDTSDQGPANAPLN